MDKISSTPAQPPTPTTPANPAIEAAKREMESRPGTPAPILEKDEREEFLKRENELTDQIFEKESTLAAQEKLLSEMKEELGLYKSQEDTITKVLYAIYSTFMKSNVISLIELKMFKSFVF
jgi:kinesin family protein 5